MRDLDAAHQRAFGGQMVGCLNQAMLAIMMRIGHRTGLFAAMTGAEPASCADIARAARLDEPFVAGWLGALVTGRVIEYDGKRGLYQLPAEHAAALRFAGPPAMSGTFSLLAALEEELVACLRGGGAMPPAVLARAAAARATDDAGHLDGCLVPAILPLCAGLPARLAAGIDVLEIGGGRAAALMAAAYPRSRFAAIALDRVTAHAGTAAVDLVAAVEGVDHPAARADAVLEHARGALRAGGLLLLVDVAASSHLADNLDHPLAPALYAASTLRAGAPWGEERAREAILAAGFADLEVKRLDGDLVHNYYFARATG